MAHAARVGDFVVTFWGVRGSIATPGPDTSRVGGNTSCVEVQVGGHRIVLDGGTGLRNLGQQLQARSAAPLGEGDPLDAHLFFSHLHWDHIQGLPFFAPLFHPESVLRCYAGRMGGASLREALQGQMSAPYFPVDFARVAGALRTRDVAVREAVHLDRGVSVYGIEGNHPGGVFAWRIEYAGHSLVYATDTEPHPDTDRALVQLAHGADVLIHDAQYTPEEYDGRDGLGGHVGWGHGTMLDAARIAREARVGALVLFHHDPAHDDDTVAAMEDRAREAFALTVAAREGLSLEVPSAHKTLR
jgi:phosphoribosyl 1,2-cyclic phosphodiesterase